MDPKSISLLYPFNYSQWKPNMSACLKIQCLFDVSIGDVREPKS